jgi:hypothetical protein
MLHRILRVYVKRHRLPAKADRKSVMRKSY